MKRAIIEAREREWFEEEWLPHKAQCEKSIGVLCGDPIVEVVESWAWRYWLAAKKSAAKLQQASDEYIDELESEVVGDGDFSEMLDELPEIKRLYEAYHKLK